jgi:hypothetical protein
MKRGYAAMNTPSPPPANALDLQAQLLQMTSIMQSLTEQIQILKSGSSGSGHQFLTTPKSSFETNIEDCSDIALIESQGKKSYQQQTTDMEESSDNALIESQGWESYQKQSNSDNVLIGSQSRTSSKSSNSNHSSMKVPTSHPHFMTQHSILSSREYKDRLVERLSEAVLESELKKKFPALYSFREEYIIPLARKFPCTKDIELTSIEDDDNFLKGFESSYDAIFVKGCHIPRTPRKKGQQAIEETKERRMYRTLIKDLWEILGLIFDMLTEP